MHTYFIQYEKIREQEESQKKAEENEEVEPVLPEKKIDVEEDNKEEETERKLIVSAKIIERMLNLNTYCSAWSRSQVQNQSFGPKQNTKLTVDNKFPSCAAPSPPTTYLKLFEGF